MDTQLEWNEHDGFILNCQGSADGVSLHLVGVAVPADGREALRAGVNLYKLDLLFKAQASLGADLAQVVDGSVTHDEDTLTLTCKVEDMETGDVRVVTVTSTCPIDGAAPERGGPVASEPDENDLDMEDEFDLPLPSPPRRPPAQADATDEEPSNKQDGIGRLLQALLQVEEGDPLGALEEPESDADTEAAERFLQILIDNEGLELEDGATVANLAPGAAPFLDGGGHPDQRASALSEWLLEQDSVADLYITDEDLSHLIAQW